MTDPRVNIQITGSDSGVRKILRDITKDVSALASELNKLSKAEVTKAKSSAQVATAEARAQKALAQRAVAEERAKRAILSTSVASERLIQSKRRTVVADERVLKATADRISAEERVKQRIEGTIVAEQRSTASIFRRISAEQQATASIARKESAIARATIAQNRAELSTRKLASSEDALTRKTQATERQFKGLISTYVKLRIALDAVQAVSRAVLGSFQFAQQGAEITQVSRSFDNLATSVFELPDLLDRLRESARGTVSDISLQRSVLQLTAGVSQNLAKELASASPALLEIARSASILNPALGDTQVFFDRLSLGIKRSSSRIIDDLGIIVKVGEANERFADSIGKVVSELTAEEKQLALLNEVLRNGQNLIDQVGDSVDSAVDPFFRLKTEAEELKNTLAVLAGEGFTPLADPISNLISRLNAGIKSLGATSGGIDQVGKNLGNLATEADDAGGTLGRIFDLRTTGFAEFVRAVAEQGLSGDVALLGTALTLNNVELESQLDQATASILANIASNEASLSDGLAKARSSVVEGGGVLFGFRDIEGETGAEVDFSGATREALEEALTSVTESEDGVIRVELNESVFAELFSRSQAVAFEGFAPSGEREVFDLKTVDLGITRFSDQVAELTEEEEALAEASRDLVKDVISSVSEVDDLTKILIEAGDEANITEEELISLAVSTGVLDEKSAETAISIANLTRRAQELSPALSRGSEQAIAEFAEIKNEIDALTESTELIQSPFAKQSERTAQSFAQEQLSLLSKRLELEERLAEATVTQVGSITKDEAIARQRAKLAQDLTNEIRDDLEERLENEEISAQERVDIEQQLQADLSNQERRETLKRIAEIQLVPSDTLPVFGGDAQEAKNLQEQIESINEELASNFRKSVFESAVSANGLTRETLELGIALGVVDQAIRSSAVEAIDLADEFQELTRIFDSEGVTSAQSQAKALEILASGEADTAREAFNLAEAEKEANKAISSGASIAGERSREQRAGLLAETAEQTRAVADAESRRNKAVSAGVRVARQRNTQQRRSLRDLEGLEQIEEEIEEAEEVIDPTLRGLSGVEEEDANEIEFNVNTEEVLTEFDLILDIIDGIVGEKRFIELGFDLDQPPSSGGGGGGIGELQLAQFGGRGINEPFVAGEVRPELIVPSSPVNVSSRVPSGFNSSLSEAVAQSISVPPSVTNTTNISRVSESSSQQLNVENINIGGSDAGSSSLGEIGTFFLG